ncbi:hypothetical protein BWX40_11900 [Prevotella intermedia]|nr:hypothetical protein BWX40_11900 [Prevotella intermedia]
MGNFCAKKFALFVFFFLSLHRIKFTKTYFPIFKNRDIVKLLLTIKVKKDILKKKNEEFHHH